MVHIGYEQIEVTNAVQTANALTIPANATHCRLQAQDGNVNYTMDGVSDPSASAGMILHAGLKPEEFEITDLRNIRFTKDAGAPKLNISYLAGRDV